MSHLCGGCKLSSESKWVKINVFFCINFTCRNIVNHKPYQRFTFFGGGTFPVVDKLTTAYFCIIQSEGQKHRSEIGLEKKKRIKKKTPRRPILYPLFLLQSLRKLLFFEENLRILLLFIKFFFQDRNIHALTWMLVRAMGFLQFLYYLQLSGL